MIEDPRALFSEDIRDLCMLSLIIGHDKGETQKSINKTKLKKDYYFFGTSMTKKGDVNYNFNI